jgi:Flp pilus assembly protein TadG
MRRLLPRRPASRGQALVEFAVVFPIFAMLFFGLIDIGRYVFATNDLNEAAREAARYGSVEQWAYTCPASVATPDRFTCTKAVALSRVNGTSLDPSAGVVVTCSDGAGNTRSAINCRPNDVLKIVMDTGTGSYQFRFFTPLIAQIVTPPRIQAQAQVAIQ